MKFSSYVKDKSYQAWILLISIISLSLMMNAFKISYVIQIILFSFLILIFFLFLIIEYTRKRNFYSTLQKNIKEISPAYFVLETMEKPEFLEGKLFLEIMYEINKSMCEEVNKQELQNQDFKDYLEMWIHEVKIPIAALILMAHKLENYVEQILYYARSENASVDYLIKKVSLAKIVSEVALKNKDMLLKCKIDFIVNNVNINVNTDLKWLIFIVNQIVNNSVKYRKNTENSYIKISATEEEKIVKLIIEDNGIGILEEDLPRVFDKTFTGTNGRDYASSTGMGLFIAKSLCQKLGHDIKIESKRMEYTRIIIFFSKNPFYDVLDITKK